jgi:hypothetical protein
VCSSSCSIEYEICGTNACIVSSNQGIACSDFAADCSCPTVRFDTVDACGSGDVMVTATIQNSNPIKNPTITINGLS